MSSIFEGMSKEQFFHVVREELATAIGIFKDRLLDGNLTIDDLGTFMLAQMLALSYMIESEYID